MTNTPNFIRPSGTPEKGEAEEPTRQVPIDRPKERSTPSQQGRFLSALENKEKKSQTKHLDEEGGEGLAEGEGETTVKKDSVFSLAPTKEVQKEKPLKDALSKKSPQEIAENPVEEKKLKPNKEQERMAGEQAVSQKPTTFEKQQPSKAPQEKGTAPVPSSQTHIAEKAPPQPTKPFVAPKQQVAQRIEKAPQKQSQEESQDTDLGKDAKEHVVAAPPPLPQTPQRATIAEQTPVQKSQESRAAILEIIKQTIEALSTMQTKAETTTTIQIKHPPMFAGASLEIVETKTAKGEFNITFANLSPEARRIIESQANQMQLQQSLLERGYTLRNVVIAPDVSFRPQPSPIPAEGSSQTKRESQQGSGFTGQEDASEERKRR